MNLSWVQETSSIGICSPITRKSSIYLYSRHKPIPSNWGGLRWTTLLSNFEKKRREGLHPGVCYACCLTRGVYLDLLPNHNRRGPAKPQDICRAIEDPDQLYSDNDRTFIGAAKWMKAVMKDEKLQKYLSIDQIRWQFNLGWITRKDHWPNKLSFEQSNRKWVP